jgi:UDP-glucose 4-epimerase
VEQVVADVRSPEMVALCLRTRPQSLVHLASIVTPGKHSSREFEYSVDVAGTENVLSACLAAGVRQIVVTSSGAAYGYHADNPDLLTEDHPLRGNDSFAYSRHKRLVEEMLARYRSQHPTLRQLIFRPGTILGEGTRNQITALFQKPRILGIRGSDSPFVFIWDQDVVAVIVRGVKTGAYGIYNLAGDGAMGLAEIARTLGKPYLSLPAWLVRAALALAKPLGLTAYGPEQVDFLRYRPVLDNRRLKEEFGYPPQKTSREAFEVFARSMTRSR